MSAEDHGNYSLLDFKTAVVSFLASFPVIHFLHAEYNHSIQHFNISHPFTHPVLLLYNHIGFFLLFLQDLWLSLWFNKLLFATIRESQFNDLNAVA